MKTRILASLAAALAAAAPTLATDNCAVPTPLAGSVVAPFDMSQGQLEGFGINSCSPAGAGFARDYWFCWTSDVDGMVTISTCGLTALDTGVAIYPASLGCACPGDLHPLCCNDDAGANCGKQSHVTCEVRCGERYMIQVAARPSGASPLGQVRIQTEGTPCGGGGNGNGNPPGPVSCECCGGRPSLVDNLTTPFDPGLVAAATNYDAVGTDPALWLVDLGNQGAAPVGTNWNTDRYSHPAWTMANLGGIFGVTLDGAGNIFVGHSAVYNNWSALGDPVGFGGAGAVYRIDGATGTPTLVLALPQQVDPSQPIGEEYPGLGQLSWSCPTSRLFVSNFEDGRIYSIDPTNGAGFKVQSTYTHGGAVTGALPNANLADPSDGPGFAGLGKRVWAVKAAGSRVYYSVWSRDSGRTGSGPNQIWSVAIDGSGNFVANSQALELTLPSRPGTNYSNPVADITFDANCCMLVAERSMYSDTSTNAHDARVMRFCQGADNAWSQDITFGIGIFSGENSTGGVGYETGGADQVWAMSDAISYPSPMVYGLQGQDAAGQTVAASFWVDLDGVQTDNQKTMLGSIDVNCLDAAAPCEFSTLDIDCVPNADGTMGYLWSVQITNNSPVAANLLILGDLAFSPNNVVVLNPPLAPGASMVIDIPISIGVPGSTFCFQATLAASAKDACCSEEICIELPDCTCMDTDVVVTDLPGNGGFTFSMNLMNLANAPAFAGEWVTLAVAPGYPATVNPTLVNIPTLPVYASTNVGPITVSTALPAGSTIVVIVGIHSATFHPCCFREITLTVPAQAGSSGPGDANADGVVNGADMAMLLSNWGGSGSTDFNGDGRTDGQDLAILLANWS